MRRVFGFCIGLALFGATSAVAEMTRITSKEDFLSRVDGKTLARPLIKLFVTADGNITGSGASLPVSGDWVWKDGYFCRNLTWGKRDLGYNCQEITSEGQTIRFTSDQGKGDHADFKFR